MNFSNAVVRVPGSTFADGLTMSGAQGRADVGKALDQHAAYCRALRECGLDVTVMASDKLFPDSTFVEDTAVIADRVAVITRPGAETRAGEVAAVGSVLHGFRPRLEYIESPGTVDGGDICQVHEHFLIGLSARTNEPGARQLADILSRHGYASSVVDIRQHRTLLHLKSGIAWLGDYRCVVAPGFPRTKEMATYEMIETAAHEAYAANCVRINDDVLVAAGFPELTTRLQGLGYQVRPLDVSEFRKMDGGLSCLSLRF